MDTRGAFPKRGGVVPKTVQRWVREGRRKRASHGHASLAPPGTDTLAVMLGLAPPVNKYWNDAQRARVSIPGGASRS